MEIRYRRELSRNYLIISKEDIWNGDYRIKMLESNRIPGLLSFYSKEVDGEVEFYYEISSRQPLSRILEIRTITEEELRKLFFMIAAVLKRMESYLLEERQILLEAEYIYVSPESFDVSLCCIPGLMGNFPESLRMLLQYLLNKVNYKERAAVAMVYRLYQVSLKENYHIQDLLECMKISRESEQEVLYENGNEVYTDSEYEEEPELKSPVTLWFKNVLSGRKTSKEPVLVREDSVYHYEEAEGSGYEEENTICFTEYSQNKYFQVVLKSRFSSVTGDIVIDQFPFVIGKSKSDVNYILDHRGVSRLHLKFERIGNDIIMTDLNSTNGTYVNGVMLNANEERLVLHGDKIVIAGLEFDLYIHM